MAERNIPNRILGEIPGVAFLTREQRLKMQSDIAMISQVGSFIASAGGRTVVIGGYETDAHRGSITRFHHDVDLHIYLSSNIHIKGCDVLSKLFPKDDHWTLTNFQRTNEVIVQNPQTNQRIDIRFYELIERAGLQTTIAVRKPGTNFSEDVALEAVTFTDLENTKRTIWTDTVSHAVASRIIAMRFHPRDLSRRSIRQNDFDDLQHLLSSPQFNRADCEKHLADAIERLEKVDKQAALVFARRYVDEYKAS